ncbi:conserved hypothetical protein [Vibrio chagasii]|uniref:Uncharacterized protein n=1 Tax=Vibrio coralliirubri TaxID=1516159 RepID=A0AA86XBR3_9VIBR|nr:conserved hypothetical protein [Vibrio chagasii]CDT74162.1 hypothetical protein VCR31J2_1300124 [Vibrio coralliirubri]CDT91279.1 hypothetical protein VCR29J2_80065 [Vibrio coralliirubri]
MNFFNGKCRADRYQFINHSWTEAFSHLVNDALFPVWGIHQKSTTLEAKFIVTYEKRKSPLAGLLLQVATYDAIRYN